MNWELFAAFLLITMVLVVTPGPIVTLVIATGASRGIRAGLITVVGTTLGNAVLLAAIACGLSWVLRNAAVLFEVLRWVGAAYLVWLGVQAWWHAGKAMNPKTIAFFTAFLPQFVDAALPIERQLLIMCSVTVVLAALSDAAWAIAAGLGRAWFMTSWRAKLLGRLSGTALIGGGIWLSLARRPA